jgi:hypothetical protein
MPDGRAPTDVRAFVEGIPDGAFTPLPDHLSDNANTYNA